MGEHPIIFSTEMVRAILDGRKTKSRRIIMPQPFRDEGEKQWVYRYSSRKKECLHYPNATEALKDLCPYGQVGDRLWVRETHWLSKCGQYIALPAGKRNCYPIPPDIIRNKEQVASKITYAGRKIKLKDGKLIGGAPVRRGEKEILNCVAMFGSEHKDIYFERKSSIHMPKWAARTWLEITNIRVERVQDISLKDVISEGIKDTNKCVYNDDNVFKCNHHDTLDKFKNLWDSLNAKRGYGWQTNPWCWVIEFKRKEKP